MGSLTKLPLIRNSCLILFSSILASGAVLAQTDKRTEAPQIQILKLNWKRQVRLPRNFDPSVMPATGGFTDPAKAAGSGNSASAVPAAPFEAVPYATFGATPNRLQSVYVFSIQLKNAGVKTIAGIAWDYIFIDKDQNHELAKHSFLSYGSVLPEQRRSYHVQLNSPAVKVVSATAASAKPRPTILERAVIQCVLYEDDTVWQKPEAPEGICESLKTRKSLGKQSRS